MHQMKRLSMNSRSSSCADLVIVVWQGYYRHMGSRSMGARLVEAMQATGSYTEDEGGAGVQPFASAKRITGSR